VGRDVGALQSAITWMTGLCGCALRRATVALLLIASGLLACAAASVAAGRVEICSVALGADGGRCFHYAVRPAQLESGADGRTLSSS
jgi:hypothetical protein